MSQHVVNHPRQSSPSAKSRPLQVLRVDSSSRITGSVTRDLSEKFVQQIQTQYPDALVKRRDVSAEKLPFINASCVDANFTAVDQRTLQHRKVLAQSDRLVKELKLADVIVMGLPIYNFGIPASLKAWIDLIARAGLSFRYTKDGPEGLINGKKPMC